MRLAGYEVSVRPNRFKQAAAAVVGIAAWLAIAYPVGYAAHTYTAYSIADVWPLPVGFIMAGSSVVALVLLSVAAVAAVGAWLFSVEEVPDR